MLVPTRHDRRFWSLPASCLPDTSASMRVVLGHLFSYSLLVRRESKFTFLSPMVTTSWLVLILYFLYTLLFAL